MLLRVLKWFFKVENRPFLPKAPEAPVAEEVATAEFEQTMSRYRRHPRFLDLTLSASTAGDDLYTLTAHNVSDQPIYGITVHYAPLLHPGQFGGLDDTHMPADIWVHPPCVLLQVHPGESASTDVKGYDIHTMYDGDIHRNVEVSFRVGNVNEQPVTEPSHPNRIQLPFARGLNHDDSLWQSHQRYIQAIREDRERQWELGRQQPKQLRVKP